MKLATFTYARRTGIGVVVGDEIVELASAAPELPREMTALLAGGRDALAAAARAAEHPAARIPLDDVHLEAPIRRPPKLLGVGLNYADHVAEAGLEVPRHPPIFNKQVTCVNGPYDPVHRPRVSRLLDYEGELALVIGRRCRHVPRERAAEVIAGYTVMNDVSVRDWQLHSPTITIGKSFDSHGPMGPWIVTADEISDPQGLGIRTWVNGELRQDSNTKAMIFGCAEVVAYLSTVFSLEPGDVVTTGTPAGTAGGFDPPRWLEASDVVRIEIERIGQIENPVIEEPDTALL